MLVLGKICNFLNLETKTRNIEFQIKKFGQNQGSYEKKMNETRFVEPTFYFGHNNGGVANKKM